MKKNNYIKALLVLFVLFTINHTYAQAPNPYCIGTYGSGVCNQGGPSNSPNNSVNDFINSANTTGGNVNFCNNGSGCNGNANNYTYYSGSNALDVTAGQTITVNLQSGITFPQGFVIFIDWNQNNIFEDPAEMVAFTPGVPPAATWVALTFTIPANISLGTYRMRIRCAFATPGNNISPCGAFGFGETEDYDLIVSPPGGTYPALTATLTSNGPVCAGQTLSITLNTAIVNPTVAWSGPNNFTATSQNVSLPSAMTGMSGTYSATIGTACPLVVSINVLVVPYPIVAVAPPTIEVCQGGAFIANTTINGNPQNYSFQYLHNSSLLTFSTPTQPVNVVYTSPISTTTALVVYSVVVTPTILNCPVTTTMSVLISNPPTPTLTMPNPMCNNFGQTTVSAVPSGGTWYGNPIVSPTGIVTPGSAAAFGIFPVSYSIMVGICTATNQANISINQFRTAALNGAIPNKCTLDNGFNLMSITQNTAGGWGGPNVNQNNYFFPGASGGLPTGTYVLTYFNTSFPNPNVCPMTSTTTVQVFNPVTPTINPIPPRCHNSPTVMLSATPGGGTWSANSGVNMYGTLNPANVINTAGSNNVVYTAGQGTCVSVASTTFHVSRFNTAALTSTNLSLCESGPPVNLMSLVQSTINGSWAGNPNGNTSMFSPAGLPTGALTLTYNTTSNPNPTLCPASSVLYIAVLNPTVPSITQIGPFCTVDAPIQLTVTPATGSFIPTPYLTAGGLFNPALSGVGNNQIQYMIGTSTCNAVDTKSISIEAFVPATVSGPLPDQCSTGQIVNLVPYSQSQAGIWSGPGVLGTGFNPGNSGVGVIVIQYNTSSFPSGLCPDQQNTSVTVYSLATPVIASEGPFCNSAQPVSLRANPLGGVFQSSSTHAVSPGGLFNPAFAAIGSNVVNYSVAAGPCIAFTQTFIDVEEFVTAKFSKYLNPICKTNSSEDMNSYVQRTGGTWSGPGMLGSIFTPANANVGNNNIIVYRTHSPTEYLCPDSSAMRIEVVDVPVLEVVASTVKGCAPVEVELNIPNTNAGDGEWTFGDGTTQTGLSATHVYNVPGTYSVTFNYWTPHTRCFTQSLLKEFIVIHELPKPAFTYGPYKEVTISDPEIKLQNLTPNVISNTYLWNIDQMYTTTEVDPQPVRFPKTGDYRISLTATSAQGCVNEVSDIIRVEPDFRVYIPNSFTPNFDGINDEFFPVFSPFGLDPKTYELEIFDRWGKSVFITKDVTKGWNGTVQGKGVDPMKQEVYIYKIKYKDLEGRIYNKNGSVTVTN